MEPHETILEFWFGPGKSDGERLAGSQRWWKKDPAFDAEIRQRFEPLFDRASRGELERWRATPEPCLAYVLLLDQFPRNMYRGKPMAFAQDPKALRASLDAQYGGLDVRLSLVQRWFLYMPMMHAENRSIQRRSVEAYARLVAEASPELESALESAHDFAVRHAEIIERFGRYPHRNEILGRESTAEERAFLEQPDSSF